MRLLAWVAAFAAWTLSTSGDGTDDDAPRPMVNVLNMAGMPIDMYWLKDSGDEVLLTSQPLKNGSSSVTHAKGTHKFAVRFASDRGNGKKGRAEARFVKQLHHEIAVVTSFDSKLGFVPKQLTVWVEPITTLHEMQEYTNGKSTYVTPASVRALEPQQRVEHAINVCNDFKGTGDLWNKCFLDAAGDDFEAMQRRKDAASKSAGLMAHRLRAYTCADDTVETSPPLYTTPLRMLGNEVEADVLHDTPHSKIWTVHNLITDDECGVLRRVLGPHLRRATVVDDDGNVAASATLMAQQAKYVGADGDGLREGDPLYSLYKKIFDITNHVAGFDLQPDGQEGFAVIQYNVGDQYKPHCDGDCSGAPHATGGRVASCVLYCEAPTRGGSTTFSKADVLVRPEKGMATFFTYKGADGYMDEGLTEHSGCPLLEGEKWISTVWMREGVSDRMPEYKFGPTGGLLHDEDDRY